MRIFTLVLIFLIATSFKPVKDNYPCHPLGDLGPCTHAMHPVGDVGPCTHTYVDGWGNLQTIFIPARTRCIGTEIFILAHTSAIKDYLVQIPTNPLQIY